MHRWELPLVDKAMRQGGLNVNNINSHTFRAAYQKYQHLLTLMHRPHQLIQVDIQVYPSYYRLFHIPVQARRKRSGRLSTSPTKNSGSTGSGGPRPYQKLAQALPKIQPRRKRSGRLGSARPKIQARARPNEKCFRRACGISLVSTGYSIYSGYRL